MILTVLQASSGWRLSWATFETCPLVVGTEFGSTGHESRVFIERSLALDRKNGTRYFRFERPTGCGISKMGATFSVHNERVSRGSFGGVY